MKNQFVNKLQEGDYVNDYFVATRKDLRPKQSGGKFLGMVFQDRTGDIGGVMWNNANDVARLFEVGDVVNVRGKISTYQNRLQIQVDQVLPLRAGDFSLEDLIATSGNVEDDLTQLRGILDAINDPWLKQLNDLFLGDAEFVARFTQAAAGKKWHHEYRGGLLRHVYEMARIALTMCDLYPEIDRDMLLTGVFLHDIGKIDEMSHGLAVEYTTAGKLVGHLQIGGDLVQEKIRQLPGFPEKHRLQLLHMVLSHHGEYQNGAPVLPKTLEAIVLHHIDNLDAQAAAITRVVRETRDRQQEWSDFQPLIDRVIWTKAGA